MELAIIIGVIVVALGFDFTNGFNDAATAIATTVSTRAMTPRSALVMAAVLNLLGAFLGTKVASTVGKGIIDLPHAANSLVVVLAALLGAVTWNIIVWRLGIPSSSTYALIGGLIGAALAARERVQWHGVLSKVAIPMIVSPILGLVVAALLMTALLWVFRRFRPAPVTEGFRRAQIISGAATALGHGLQDAQKTMGVISLALVVGGVSGIDTPHGFNIPWWVIVAAAGSLSLGTYAGGFRIMRTLGRRITALDPPRAFAAQTSASALLYAMAYVFAAPVSTVQTITSSVLGAGATRRLSAVRWGVGLHIVVTWVLTIPSAGLVAALCYWGLHTALGV